MRRIVLIALLTFVYFFSSGQIHVGNDTVICYGESITLWADVEISYDYQPITFNYSDSVYQDVIPIGFPFMFYGMTFNYIVISPNGWIGFNQDDAGTLDIPIISAIPSMDPSVPKNCIMGPWMDWYPYTNDVSWVGYETIGTAPDRKFVVDFFNLAYFNESTGDYGTFQIVLNESDHSIENHITIKPDEPGPWPPALLATQGIINMDGTNAVTVPGHNATNWSANHESWKYTSSSPYTYDVSSIEFDPVIVGQLSEVSWYKNTFLPGYYIESGSSITVTPGQTTSYIAVVLLNEVISYMDTIIVSVRYQPVADAGNDEVIIQNTQAILDGSGSSGTGILSYHWEPSGMVINPDQSITQTIPLIFTQLFKLAVRDELGCRSDTDEVVIAVQNSPLFANLSVDKSTVCSGDTVKLQVVAYGGDLSVPYSYDWWSDPWSPIVSTDSVVDAIPIVTTIFYVRVSDLNEEFIDSVTVHVPVVDPHISGSSQVCEFQVGSVYHCDSTGNFFNWSVIGITPQSISVSNNSLTINWGNTGTGYITVLETTNDQYSCVDADTFAVTVYPNPIPLISGDSVVCEGDSRIFFTPYTFGNTYEWNLSDSLGIITNPDSNEITVHWTNEGMANLFVIETSPSGCQSYESFDVLINPLHEPLITGDSSVCKTETVIYQSPCNPGNSLVWNITPDSLGVIIPLPDPNQIMIIWEKQGTSELEVSEIGPSTFCGDPLNVLHITVNPLPLINLVPAGFTGLGSDTISVCVYDTLILDAGNPDFIYEWSNQSWGQTIQVSTTGIGSDVQTYWVKVTNPQTYCTNSDTLTIFFDFTECTGIQEHSKTFQVKVFPNPAYNLMTVSLTDVESEVDMEILDMSGQAILRRSIGITESNHYTEQLDLSQFHSGIYLLKVFNDKELHLRKIILE